MTDISLRLYSAIVSLWRRRWIIIGFAWLVCLIGWAFVALMPDRYVVTARVYVDTDTLLAPLLKGISVDVINMSQQVEIMQQTLLSRPNLENTLRRTGLQRIIDDPARADTFIRNLQKMITIFSEGKNLFSVTYSHSDPERAKALVESLLEVFVETNLGSHRFDIEQARRFIDSQLEQTERDLRLAEERLAKFKQEHIALLPDKSNHATQLENARQQSRQLANELAEAQTRLAILKRQIAATPQFIEVPAPVVISGRPSELETRIVELQKSLDLMTSQYTESHPDVVATRRSLKLLKDEYESELRNPSPRQSAARTAKQVVRNVFYEQLTMRGVDLESEVRGLERRLADQKDEMQRLEQAASSVPQIETEFKSLEREYQAIRKNHEELLARREQARLSQEVGEKAEKTKYRVVDPPNLPKVPMGPNRPLLMTLVLAVAFGAGGLLAYGLAQIDDSFSTTQQARQALAYPVIGGVSLLMSTAQARRRAFANACFTAALAFLFVSYGGALVLFSRLIETTG